MTAIELQENLANELCNIFSEVLFEDTNGEKRKGINVYQQNLPVRKNDDDEEEPAPYIIVRLETGDTKDYISEEIIQMTLIIMVCESNVINEGHKTVLNVIHRIKERFEKNNTLKGMYYLNNPINWALQDEDTYPFYIGAAEMKWRIAAIRKEADTLA